MPKRSWRRKIMQTSIATGDSDPAFQGCVCNDLANLDSGRAGYRAGDFRQVMNSAPLNAALPVTAKITFRAQAWTAANDKARELGWIV
jgi:hypothetical protein